MNKLILAILILFAGCAHTYTSREIEAARLRADLKLVRLEDGISELEAAIIARNYFIRYVGCGMFYGISDGGQYWIVNGGIGYAGMPC